MALLLISDITLVTYHLAMPLGLSEKAKWAHLPWFGIRVFLLLGSVCPWHLLFPVLPSYQFSRAFPISNPGMQVVSAWRHCHQPLEWSLENKSSV